MSARRALRPPAPVLALLAAVVASAPRPAGAQRTIGLGTDFLTYSFDEGLGIDNARLLLTPLAIRLPVTSSFTLDFYSAWARGTVDQDGTEFAIDGIVDTQVKASYQASPWALFSVGVNLPTGNSTHDTEEALVASVLATDLLGFREATWGTGFAVTSSLATAVRAGSFGIGLAGSYSARSEFEPTDGTELDYEPGDETRVRLGIDRNFGTSTLTVGATFFTYGEDQVRGSNLFQSGDRYRIDASYAFRAGAGVWTVYASDLWRERGGLSLSVVNDAGAAVGDTTMATANQNLFIAGVQGAVGLGGAYVFRPHVDLRFQSRDEPDGRDEGSGWILAAGGDLPVRLFGGYDFFPKARFLVGSIEDAAGDGQGVFGVEVSATVRWSF